MIYVLGTYYNTGFIGPTILGLDSFQMVGEAAGTRLDYTIHSSSSRGIGSGNKDF